jgi:hypothetical protein
VASATLGTWFSISPELDGFCRVSRGSPADSNGISQGAGRTILPSCRRGKVFKWQAVHKQSAVCSCCACICRLERRSRGRVADERAVEFPVVCVDARRVPRDDSASDALGAPNGTRGSAFMFPTLLTREPRVQVKVVKQWLYGHIIECVAEREQVMVRSQTATITYGFYRKGSLTKADKFRQTVGKPRGAC